MSDVIKFGRIQYIEPNEIFGGDNQPVNQEDLSKYVNLSVKIPSRYYNENSWVKSYDTILRGESFDTVGEYTKIYLTDNYVNVSYTEFKKNGEISVGELFGIDSIDISFDVQFFPQVTINFTDIKGFGLMSTMEYNYSEGKINDITAKSFFTSLFNFPYPIFTLEVKGYYGKSVSFDLSLSDFHTAFDSISGNFKTTVKFIGHMYGVYTDIPMSYLMVSPYLFCNVTLTGNTLTNGDVYSNTWTSISNGYPTYLEFISSFNNLLIGDYESTSLVEDARQNETILPDLIKAKTILNPILSACENQRLKYKYLIKKPNRNFISNTINMLYLQNNTIIDSTFTGYTCTELPATLELPKGNISISLDILKKGGVFSDIVPTTADISILRESKSVTDYNEISERIGLSRLTVQEITGTKPDIEFTEYDMAIGFEYKVKLVEYVGLTDLVNSIDRRIQSIQETEQKNREKTAESLRQIVNNTIGFDPCIKNYYKLLFKHLNCFTKNIYKTIDEVNNKINSYERSLNVILNGYDTDVKINVSEENQEGIQIPQFPLVRNDKMEIIYPGDIETFKNEPEIKLVDEIYSSMLYFGTNSRNIFNTINNNRTIVTRGIINSDGLLFNDILPYNYYDEIKDKNVNIVKNYAIFNTRRSDINTVEDVVNNIKKLFLSRLCLFNRIHAPKNENWKTVYTSDSAGVAESEANLLYFNFTELHNLYPDFFDKLNSISDDDIVSTFNTFTGLSYGIINYKPGMENKEVNELFEYDIHTNDISSSVLVLEKGSYEKCSSYLESIGFSGRKNGINTMTEDTQHSPYCSGTTCNGSVIEGVNHNSDSINVSNIGVKRNSNSEGYIEGLECDTLRPTSISGLIYNKNYYSQRSYPVGGHNYTAHIIYTPKIYANSALLNWAFSCKKYYYAGKQMNTNSCGSRVGITTFELQSNSDTSRINNNKISIVKLYQLRALGEFFKYESDGCIIGYFNKEENKEYLNTSGNDLDDNHVTDRALLPYINSFYCGFEGSFNGPFKDFCIKCYEKKLFGDIGDNEEENYYLVIAKNQQFSDNNTGMTRQYILEYWKAFCTSVGNKYGLVSNFDLVEEYETRMEKEREILNLKTNIYYTLKNLYDKWFCSLNRNIFEADYRGNEMDKFKFLNVAMGDISNEMVFNYETSLLHIEETLKGSTSVMEFMTQTAEKNKSTFLTLPINIFDNTTEDGLKNIFKPFSFYNLTTNHDSHGVSYIFIHNGDVSHNLNIEGSEYVDDGYDMVSYNSTGLTENEIAQKIFNDHDSVVNAFGVTYGMQNQNFFKNISVDTSNPTITDYSIANTIVLAEGGDNATGLNNIAFKEKSLYPIYANRSYNCTVEMLGCMYITPLMYFQLNNIPMFRGAYIITNVNHKITPNDFTTIFTGVRVSKYKIPINVEAVSLSLLGFGYVNENDENGSNNSDSDTSTCSGESVNINTDNDTVNLNVKDGEDCKCFFKFECDCDKKKNNPDCDEPGNAECCDCHRSAVLSVKCLLQNYGINDDGSYASRTNSIRLTYEKNNVLYYFCLEGEDYKNKYDTVVKSIINHLNNKKPVIVGVNHTFNKGINEGTSDHWVTIYAYGYSGSTLYFRYFESGSNHASSTNRDDIFLYEDGDKPKLYNNRAHPSGGVGAPRRYDVTVVKLWHDISTLGYTLQDYTNGSSVSSIPIS